MSGTTATAGDRLTGAAIACELFKVLRLHWLDREQIALQIGISRRVTDAWCEELLTHGMLIERPRRSTGRAAREFTLAPEWGGQAA
jgi:hypothetical protein